MPAQKKPVAAAPDPEAKGLWAPVRRLIEITPRQRRTQRTLVDWPIPNRDQNDTNSLVLWASGFVARSLQTTAGMRLDRASPDTQNPARLSLILNAPWKEVDYAIENPSNKLLAVAELDSDNWVGEVKHIRGKTQHEPDSEGRSKAFLLDKHFPKMGTFCLFVSGHSASI